MADYNKWTRPGVLLHSDLIHSPESIGLWPMNELSGDLLDRSPYEYDFFISGSSLSPAGISGNALWLEADFITGSANGVMVPTWQDMSGNQSHGTQTGGANQATFVDNLVNGQPALFFNGDHWYRLPAAIYQAFSNLSNYTIIAVAQATDVTDAGTIICLGDTDQAPRIFIRFNQTTKIINNRVVATSGGNSNEVLSLAAVTGFHVITAIQRGAANPQVEQYIDGTSQGTDASLAVTFATGDFSQGLIGANLVSGGSAAKLVGHIAALFVFNHALNASERSIIHSYLGTKYGITVV